MGLPAWLRRGEPGRVRSPSIFPLTKSRCFADDGTKTCVNPGHSCWRRVVDCSQVAWPRAWKAEARGTRGRLRTVNSSHEVFDLSQAAAFKCIQTDAGSVGHLYTRCLWLWLILIRLLRRANPQRSCLRSSSSVGNSSLSAWSVDLGAKNQERCNNNPITHRTKRLVGIRYAILVASALSLLLDDGGVYWCHCMADETAGNWWYCELWLCPWCRVSKKPSGMKIRDYEKAKVLTFVPDT